MHKISCVQILLAAICIYMLVRGELSLAIQVIDHILEMVIPDFLPEDLRNRLHAFKEDVIEKGHGALGWSGKLTEDDIVQAIREAEELLLLIDKYFGIPAENAEAGASSDYRADKTVVKD